MIVDYLCGAAYPKRPPTAKNDHAEDQDLSNGSRLLHRYEKMTPQKQPQDVHRDGTGLTFTTFEHHGLDVCPEAIELRDAEGRCCTYTADDEFTDNSARPSDTDLDGSGRFEPLEHGGEYPDNMPQRIRVTDVEGRSCLYTPIKVDGRVVDSKGIYPQTSRFGRYRVLIS